ncbi:Alpha/Beta hydrolase protein [Sporodiniella umbellata]|nr:Alpha/Beta hydrolase protein [Sporodiniella umbellata]
MENISEWIDAKKAAKTSIALLGASAFFAYYSYYSEISLSERICYGLCQRELNEAYIEHELMNEKEPDSITENTQFVTINGHRLRIVHKIHELGSRVPLIVFIHGLGGQVSQWEYQIEYFSQTAHVLAIDLLGCGKSEVVSDWKSYSTQAHVKDVIELLTNRYKHPSTVIVAHSYGCAIASFVAACPDIQSNLSGLVLISPKASIDPHQSEAVRRLAWTPDWLFNCFRVRDRKGLGNSRSVDRLLGAEERDEKVRKSQLKWNIQSKTSVYKRFALGMQLPGLDTLAKLNMGVLLIGGEQDEITPVSDMDLLRNMLLPLNTNVPPPHIVPQVGHVPMFVRPELVNPVISEFLIHSCALETLSGAWQILHKTKGENKWDLKNYAKWASIANITEKPIGPSLFRAMKVMRQPDIHHCPSALLAKYPEIRFIIDISNDTPPYRTTDFDHSRIEYIKFKTVSKIPPTKQEVATFIQIADACWNKNPKGQIAVHCHYGFNRTGFFICCYLIERLNVSVPDALEYFKQVRPPGIRHAHFKDELYLRYVIRKK